VARGNKRFRDALALALIAAGAGAAWATRLDKTACADLNTELSSLLASGLKEDMDKGPAWGAANLSSERLVAINRVIELQGIIEFRCGALPRAIAKPDAKPEAPAEKPGTAKAATAKSNAEDNEDAAAQKPTQKSKTMRRRRGSAATMPGVPEIAPVANAAAQAPAGAAPALTSAVPPATVATAAMPVKTLSEAPKAPAPEKAAATSAPATVPQASPVVPVSTTPQATSGANKAATVAPVTAPTPEVAPRVAASGAQKTAAKRKPSRRDSTSAYVSPNDVNTYGLPTGN